MDSEDTHVRISRPELEAESKSLGANAHQTKSQWDRQFILGHRLKTNRSIFKVKMDGWIKKMSVRDPSMLAKLRASKAWIENEGVCDLVRLFIKQQFHKRSKIEAETDMVS